MEKEVRKIKKEAFQLAWYMRGMSYAEAMNLSWDERELVLEIVKDNMDITKTSGLPFF